ncbi:uncharacterized protein LOC121412571 [Lytechinus variegatus]|uniref:uncharacterized protein LOC121412571 n=1 Tax=Lytechinus variegatus TaxID=7654 RepID=UPI001BB2686D|nr:uncharacterized protein LOC121412571 [Lytechinus variegatus]
MKGIFSNNHVGFSWIFLTLVIICTGNVINLIEGEDAHLTFKYDCNCTEVTLRHGYKSPFYRSPNPASIPLATYPQSRFTIENNVTTDRCSIHLKITPVRRNDAGTYIAQVYKDGGGLPDMKRIGMNVVYPPDKASCERREESSVRGWHLLHCTASAGTMSGLFECYQRGERLPPYSAPIKDHLLEQTFWFRLSSPVFCCSSAVELRKDQCKCDDFVWMPTNFTRSNRHIIKPCQPTTHADRHLEFTTPHVPSLLDVFDLAVKMPTTQNFGGNKCSSSPDLSSETVSLVSLKTGVPQVLKWIYMIFAGTCIMVVLCFVTCIKVYFGLKTEGVKSASTA